MEEQPPGRKEQGNLSIFEENRDRSPREFVAAVETRDFEDK